MRVFVHDSVMMVSLNDRHAFWYWNLGMRDFMVWKRVRVERNAHKKKGEKSLGDTTLSKEGAVPPR